MLFDESCQSVRNSLKDRTCDMAGREVYDIDATKDTPPIRFPTRTTEEGLRKQSVAARRSVRGEFSEPFEDFVVGPFDVEVSQPFGDGLSHPGVGVSTRETRTDEQKASVGEIACVARWRSQKTWDRQAHLSAGSDVDVHGTLAGRQAAKHRRLMVADRPADRQSDRKASSLGELVRQPADNRSALDDLRQQTPFNAHVLHQIGPAVLLEIISAR